MIESELIHKYNVPGPRYTSYPTVPYWDAGSFSTERWVKQLVRAFEESNGPEGISLYIHLPYCESMCTFCGCNRRITKNHEVEEPYIEALLKEWNLYCSLFPEKPRIKELHLGGGTPTFFSPGNLERLIKGLLRPSVLLEDHELGFEGHPNNTSYEHLKSLYELGFRRISYGIQDFDPRVQQIINRIQSYETVARAAEWSWELGYQSVNFDIVYGLPLQRLSSVEDTIEKVKWLQPDRISYYSYAHVPWIKGVGQRKFTERDLPAGPEKRQLYERGKQLLQNAKYCEIGMDHFALPHDDLYRASLNGNLHRNFMGYTPSKTQLLLGLGVSSISDAWYAFAQNTKTLEGYYAQLKQGDLPIFKGHILTPEDLQIRRHILDLTCRFHTTLGREEMNNEVISKSLDNLTELVTDDLVKISENEITITAHGKPFVRNICMAFDARLWRDQSSERLFSMTV